MKKVIIYPHPVLRRKSAVVVKWGKDQEKLVENLEKVLTKSKIGVGLSAPQFGVNQRIFVMRKGASFLIFINPQILDTFGGEKAYPLMVNKKGEKEEFLEGCLSFPNLYAPVKRWLKIKAAWEGGGAILEGLEAIIFQHELDHLNGILFIDHVKQEGKFVFHFDQKGNREPVDWSTLEKRP